MADKRLEEIRTSDMTESSVNLELVEWLKKSGVNWLLAFLLIIIAFMGFDRFKKYQAAQEDEAWATLAGVDTAASLEGVAEDYAKYGAIRELALLQAADIHMSTLRRDESQLEPQATVDDPETADPETVEPAAPLTDDERSDLLGQLERLYGEIVATTQEDDGKVVLFARARFGQAAVAEMRGDLDAASSIYDAIESEMEGVYPAFAEIARDRRSTLERAAIATPLPPQDAVTEMINRALGRDTLPELPNADGPGEAGPALPDDQQAPAEGNDGVEGSDADESGPANEAPESTEPETPEPPGDGG
ncbi:MAG: hypothetical protein ACF8PN_14140 [Phycisphaerales bacterium]